jgi:hypothetical protein
MAKNREIEVISPRCPGRKSGDSMNKSCIYVIVGLAILVSACNFNPHNGFGWPYDWPPKDPPGYTNDKGEYVADPRFSYIDAYDANLPNEWGGLLKVREKGHWVDRDYVNMQGESSLKWGLINRKGEIVVEPRFEDIWSFDDNGLATVSEDGKWGSINEKGEMVIPPRFDLPLSFQKDGLADVSINGKWGYINQVGQFVIEPKFDSVGRAFSDDGVALVEVNGKYGYINRKGEYVITPRFEDIRYYDGYGLRVKENGVWSCIDGKGKAIRCP